MYLTFLLESYLTATCVIDLRIHRICWFWKQKQHSRQMVQVIYITKSYSWLCTVNTLDHHCLLFWVVIEPQIRRPHLLLKLLHDVHNNKQEKNLLYRLRLEHKKIDIHTTWESQTKRHLFFVTWSLHSEVTNWGYCHCFCYCLFTVFSWRVP